MKYLILIYSNPASRQIWEGLSADQRADGFRAYSVLTEELIASGELIVAEALTDPALTQRVTVKGEQTITSDGPFAEVKEQLAGFFLVECETVDRAVEIAARVPEAAHIEVEVRPVFNRSAMEP